LRQRRCQHLKVQQAGRGVAVNTVRKFAHRHFLCCQKTIMIVICRECRRQVVGRERRRTSESVIPLARKKAKRAGAC
jgi:hypothetical protein